MLIRKYVTAAVRSGIVGVLVGTCEGRRVGGVVGIVVGSDGWNLVGIIVVDRVGSPVGICVGGPVGAVTGNCDGNLVGCLLGTGVGGPVGAVSDGDRVGSRLGISAGGPVGAVSDGNLVGCLLGTGVGGPVGAVSNGNRVGSLLEILEGGLVVPREGITVGSTAEECVEILVGVSVKTQRGGWGTLVGALVTKGTGCRLSDSIVGRGLEPATGVLDGERVVWERGLVGELLDGRSELLPGDRLVGVGEEVTGCNEGDMDLSVTGTVG
mgnify:CR=1 FL=1